MANQFCEQCGAQIPVDGRFCEECGAQKEQTGLTHFTRVRQLFDQAIAMETTQRDRWLEDQCLGDASLLAEIRGMMPDPGQSSFLDQPAQVPPSIAPPPSLRQDSVGPYRLLRELGRGGMGVVYLAVRDDGAFRKNVALKLLLGEQVTPEFVLRFKQERQVLAALDHPNIARILDGGDTPDGMPYYVMEFVEGLPLDQYCDEQRLSLTGRIKVFQQVCHAVDYLHQNSILHRDLKPSNILVSGDGVVKLLDFGIAKVVGAGSLSSPDLTSIQGRPLTPTYASPEQMAGGSLQKASDIYSLGVILYRLLTGQPPYEGIDDKVEKLAAHEDPPLPSANIRDDLRSAESTAQLRRAMMGELDSIVLMAMRYDPKARYQSAADFANDLQRFLDGLDVTAHRQTVAGRSVKLLKRKRAAVAVLALVVALGAFGGWQWRRVEIQKAQVAERELLLRQKLDQLDANAQLAGRPVTEEIQDVRKLKAAFAGDFTAAFTGRPGRSPERDALLDRGIRFLDKLQSQGTGNAELGLEMAEAYQQLALLQEDAAGPRTSDRQIATATYQRAADMLDGVSAAIPNDPRVRSRLAAVNQRITDLGGTATTAGGVPPSSHSDRPNPLPPPRTESPDAALKKTVILRSQEKGAPQVGSVSRPIGVVAVDQTPLAVSTVPEQPVKPADLAEVTELLESAGAKVQIADQAIAPFQQKLDQQGQTLSPDILSTIRLMHTRLDQAKREMADGNAGGAKESIAAAEQLATKVLRAVGR